MLKPREHLPEPEALLLDYAERLTHHRAGRRVLCLALSALKPPARADGHWKVVDHLLSPLILRHGGELFRLRTGDVVAVFGSADRALAERLTLKLRYLFRDDPVIEAEERAEPEASAFCRWFDLATEYDAFLALARRIRDAGADPQAGPLLAAPAEGLPGTPADDLHAPPLIQWLAAPARGVRGLAAVADQGPIVRRRAGDAAERTRTLVVPHLREPSELGFPPGDVERNPWLDEPLLGLIERRMLTELTAHLRPGEPLALMVGLDTLLSLELLALLERRAGAAGQPLLFLAPLDALRRDMARARYVRAFLSAEGHGLGASHPVGEPLGEPPLPVDGLALLWDPQVAGPAGVAMADRLSRRSVQWGETLLCNVVDRAGLAFAEAAHIDLLAGRQAESLIGAG